MANLTVNFNFPKPDRAAAPPEHVDEAFDAVAAATDQMDALFKTHADAIAGKAASAHGHTIANVTGLQDALNAKMAANATFGLDWLSNVAGAAAAPDGYVLIKSGGAWVPASAAAAIGTHGHSIAQVAGLADALTAHDTALAGLNSGAGISDKAVFRSAIGLGYADEAAKSALRANANAASLLDLRRNRIVNPCMQVSQQNGDSVVASNGAYVADQWQLFRDLSSGNVQAQLVAVTTPAGAEYRIRLSVTVAQAAMGASDYFHLLQPLEGSRVRDFLFGTANARPGVVRIGINAPAGTYCATIINAAGDRAFVGEIVIGAGEAGTDVIKEVAFVGDTAGVWPNGDVRGWSLSINFAAGSNFQGVAGWQAGAKWVTANQTNGLASDTNVFEIFDVGLKMDPDGTGVYGQFEMPEYGQALRDCQRYYERETADVVLCYYATNLHQAVIWFKTDKRVVPTTSVTASGGSVTAYNATKKKVSYHNSSGAAPWYITSWIADARM